MTLGRREFLVATAAVLAAPLAACAPPPAPEPATFDRLVADQPFYIAHRGGGRAWPEMTAYAYEQAAALPGLHALEMSACISRDGVLVLSHDPTTKRVTGADLVIGETDWETLSKLTVTAEFTLDPAQPRRPLSRFDEVFKRYIDRFVIFVEPKVPAADEPLLAVLADSENAERIVWKQPINSARFGQAKAAGYHTWGYVLDEPAHTGTNLTRYAADDRVDMIGAAKTGPDELITAVSRAAAANGKLGIMWPVITAAERALALGRGFAGIMCSEPRGLMSEPL